VATAVGTLADRTNTLRANELAAAQEAPAWSLEALAGRLVEVTGAASTATLTVCAQVIFQAQQRGRLAAWVGDHRSIFFPPDAAALGIDLAALPVVRVQAPVQIARVADILLRSRAFGVIVLDAGHSRALPLAQQTRLLGLAKKHHTAVLWLMRETARPAGGSLASLRVETTKHRAEHNCFACTVRAAKDKRHPPGWRHLEIGHGTDGLY
jgi:recombination protein RecA